MLLSSKKFIFLTFSDLALKAVVIDLAFKKPKVIFTDQKTLPEGVVFDEKIADLVRFKEEVRGFLLRNKSNLKTRKIIFGINEQEVFFHKLDLSDSIVGKQETISKFLTINLPFSLQEACVKYLQRVKNSTQIVSTKFLLLRDFVSIFENSGFELVSMSPIPLACLNMLAKEAESYLFVLIEDQSLQFAQVINQTIVFSASLKLTTTLESSKELIVKTFKNLVKVAFTNHNKEQISLHNVFVVGSEAQIVKIYLAEEKLNVEVVDLLPRFKAEETSDLINYYKNLFLSIGTYNELNFTGKKFTGSIVEAHKKNREPLNLHSFVKVVAVLLGIILLIFAVGFIRENLFSKKQDNEIKTPVDQKAEKPASTPSAKIVEEPVEEPKSQPPVPIINKQDYTIEVLNGTGTKGLANQTKVFLVSRGYNVPAVGNAPTTNYEQTVLQYKASKEAILTDLTSTLSERYSVIRGDLLKENDQFDIIIIVGRK